MPAEISSSHANLTSVRKPGTLSARLAESHREFLAFLEKRVESRAVAEDILQSAFVRSLEREHELRDEESAVAWFYRVLRNSVIDHYRQRAAASRALEAYARELSPAVPAPEIREEICGCLHALLESLKPEYRDAIRLVDMEDGSLKDLAAKAGITEANAAVRVHRARTALRKRVRLACGTCAEHGCLNCSCGGSAGCALQTA
jgi:RNA polymerase sigma-70 factor (ECF subfamily)